MVQQLLDDPTTEPVEAPAEEPEQAEDAEEQPSVAFDEPVEEPEAEEPEIAVGAEDPVAELRAEIAALKEQLTNNKPQRSEAEISAQVQARLRAEAEARDAAKVREQNDREELNESIGAVLATSGYADVEPERVTKIAERFINKRYDQIANREVGEVRNALIYLKDTAMGQEPSVLLSPKATKYAQDLGDSFVAIYDLVEQSIRTSGDYIHKDDLDKVIEARNAERNAKQPKEAIRRPASEPARAENRNSIEYWERRIAHEGEDGFPDLTSQDWAHYQGLRRRHGFN